MLGRHVLYAVPTPYPHSYDDVPNSWSHGVHSYFFLILANSITWLKHAPEEGRHVSSSSNRGTKLRGEEHSTCTKRPTRSSWSFQWRSRRWYVRRTLSFLFPRYSAQVFGRKQTKQKNKQKNIKAPEERSLRSSADDYPPPRAHRARVHAAAK